MSDEFEAAADRVGRAVKAMADRYYPPALMAEIRTTMDRVGRALQAQAAPFEAAGAKLAASMRSLDAQAADLVEQFEKGKQ